MNGITPAPAAARPVRPGRAKKVTTRRRNDALLAAAAAMGGLNARELAEFLGRYAPSTIRNGLAEARRRQGAVSRDVSHVR